MIEILRDSENFNSITFNGMFDMSLDTLQIFVNHYNATGDNLIDDYCNVVHLSWIDYDCQFHYSKEQFKEYEESISKIRRMRIFDVDLISDA